MSKGTNWKKGLAGIQYVGMTGVSAECKEAVMRLIQWGSRITSAQLLTCGTEHAFLLNVEPDDPVVVKSGFASGYLGEGPRTLSFVLQLLYAHGCEIEEYKINEDLFRRVNQAALSIADISRLKNLKPERPRRWSDYVFREDWNRTEAGTLWREFPAVMPFGIIDPRLIDLALKFSQRADDCLLTGYRRLEDRIRERTGIEEHGAKLIGKAFMEDPPHLKWKGIDEAERKGRGQLFASVFMAYRNPRAHREPAQYSSELTEFLLLNHLFLLESEAVDRRGRKPVLADSLKRIVEEVESIGSKWKRPRK